MQGGIMAYFNMLTAGANDPAVIRFAPRSHKILPPRY